MTARLYGPVRPRSPSGRGYPMSKGAFRVLQRLCNAFQRGLWSRRGTNRPAAGEIGPDRAGTWPSSDQALARANPGARARGGRIGGVNTRTHNLRGAGDGHDGLIYNCRCFVASCSAQPSVGVAVAACSFQLGIGAEGPVTIQVTPAGEFRPNDGRPLPVSAWRIDDAIASRVIDRFRARGKDPVIDYEHQTLHKETNGQPAPAAGWYQALEWRPGQGLFATVDLTARAREAIAAGEYRYFSPVFSFDSKTGDVLEIKMGALTNDPGIDGMAPLALLSAAAATFGHPHHEEPPMNKLLAAIVAALSLSAAATEDEALAALTALPPQLDELKKLRASLGIADDIQGDAAVAACTAAVAAGQQPDPTKFVPTAVADGLRTQLASLTARLDAHDSAALTARVDQAMADGVLIGDAEKAWALDLGKRDPALLTQYLANRAPIAALARTQTQGQPPAGQVGAHGLTQEELAVCTATGITPEAFAASKNPGQAQTATAV